MSSTSDRLQINASYFFTPAVTGPILYVSNLLPMLKLDQMYRIANFAIWPEPASVTVASLHCSLTMRYTSFTTNVVYNSVMRDSTVIN